MADFEIHVLNYNGARHLTRCLDSLQRLERGLHSISVNVIDNGSSDSSRELVERNYPPVNFVPLSSNLGFSRGNNEGVQLTLQRRRRVGKGSQDFDVFLNNDTEVEPGWLLQAAQVFTMSNQIGIVGSKSLFLDTFVPLRIRTEPAFLPANNSSLDIRRLGCFLNETTSGENILPDPARIRFKGAHGRELGGRWLSDDATILIPVVNTEASTRFALTLKLSGEQMAQTEIRFLDVRTDRLIRSVRAEPGASLCAEFDFNPNQFVRAVQNAGSFVNAQWEAGDLGTGEIDQVEVCTAREVQAVCGVSLFIRHGLFQELGGFDPNYFAYFEDTDLCVRARLKGYRCMLAPQSRLYHLHAGSSGGEWSPQFSRLVAWSHLLFTSKFAPPAVWRKRLADLRRAARDQFATYEATRSLDNTPQLRAYLQYLKRPGLFLGNRLKRALNCAALESVLQLPEQAASESCPAKAA